MTSTADMGFRNASIDYRHLDEYFSFDDVLIVPAYSELKSPKEVVVSSRVSAIPVVSAAMDTVTGREMQQEMLRYGGLGIHHRYNVTDEELIKASLDGPIAVSPSMGTKFLEALAVRNPRAIAVIDVAHGHTKKMLDYVYAARLLGLTVWSGNVVTPQAVEDYLELGVDTFRVGIGGGSACTTRVMSGVGVPQLSALKLLKENFGDDAILISDGGHKTTGDIVKALYYADAVILGGMLAGHTECPGEVFIGDMGLEYKRFRGMASRAALKNAGKTVRIEGVSGSVPHRGPVSDTLDEIVTAIQTGFAYCGASSLAQFRRNAKLIRVTPSTQKESGARI